MDLRTKLVFALVGVTLGSMLALGSAFYTQSSALLREESLQKLSALAESRKQDLESVLLGWTDRVRLIASRTQLRVSAAAFGATHAEAERERVRRILEDARESVQTVERLVVFDRDGHRVSGSATDGAPDPGFDMLPPEAADFEPGEAGARLLGLSPGGEGGGANARGESAPIADFLAPLVGEDGDRVGWLRARLDGAELVDVSRDFTGLGETGETMIVRASDADGVGVLHPTRHAGPADGLHPDPAGVVDPARLAAGGVDTTVVAGAYDYRDEAVWAATRFVEVPGWGIVVKVDASEERRPIDDLRGRMVRLALSSAFAILAGILLGLHLARPIHELAEVANRIREGEMGARADIRAEDEVGMLARTFNRMADTLTAERLELLADEEEEEEEDDDTGPA